ncbi:MAG TPA: hypothetical protein GX717_06035, partial [Clostridiaceae bacterium]|nr:hypothetical protein [Clostridiaceae bacterium]
MAIVKMSRFNLTIFESDKDNLLRNLQAFGDVDFANLNVTPSFILQAEEAARQSGSEELDPVLEAEKEQWELFNSEGVTSDYQGESIVELNEQIRKIKWCIETLEEVEQPVKGLSGFNNALPEITYERCEQQASELDLAEVYTQVRNIKQDIQGYKEENELARVENRDMLHFQKMDIPFDAVRPTATTEVILGSYPKRWRIPFENGLAELAYTYYEVLSVDDKNVNVFLIYDRSEAEAVAEILRAHAFTQEVISYAGTAAEKIAENKAGIKANEQALEEKNKILESLAEQYLVDFKIMYEFLRNTLVRQQARDNFLRTERTVLIEGYVPSEVEETLAKVVAQSCRSAYVLSIEEVARDDKRV